MSESDELLGENITMMKTALIIFLLEVFAGVSRARAFGEEWALENPGDYPGTIVELDEECAAGRTWLVDYEDGPTSTDEAFFVGFGSEAQKRRFGASPFHCRPFNR